MKYRNNESLITVKNQRIFKKLTMFLIHSKDLDVREAIAKMGYKLDILINDTSWVVRREVAFHGYGLDRLINDPIWMVKNPAKRKLNEKNNHK